MHRHFLACFAPGYHVSSLPSDVSIGLEVDEASSAGVRFIRWLFLDGNPRHPNATSLPGPACLVQCQKPAKNLLHFTLRPQTTQATCLFPDPSPSLHNTLLQNTHTPQKICIPKTPALKIMLFCSSATLNLEQLKNQFALRNIQFVCRCCPLKSCWVIGAGRAHRGAPDRWHKPQGWFARHDRRVTGPKQSFHIREINLSCQTNGVRYRLG